MTRTMKVNYYRPVAILLIIITVTMTPMLDYKRADAIALTVTTAELLAGGLTVLMLCAAGYKIYEVATKNNTGDYELTELAKSKMAGANYQVDTTKTLAENMQSNLARSSVQENFQELRANDRSRYIQQIMNSGFTNAKDCILTDGGDVIRTSLNCSRVCLITLTDYTLIACNVGEFTCGYYDGGVFISQFNFASMSMTSRTRLYQDPRVLEFTNSADATRYLNGGADVVIENPSIIKDGWRIDGKKYNYPATMNGSTDLTKTIVQKDTGKATLNTLIDDVKTNGVEKVIGNRTVAEDYVPSTSATVKDTVQPTTVPTTAPSTGDTVGNSWLEKIFNFITSIPQTVYNLFAVLLQTMSAQITDVSTKIGAIDITDVPSNIWEKFKTWCDGISTDFDAVIENIKDIGKPKEKDIEINDYKIGEAIITKFPFCIPWDVVSVFKTLKAEGVAPKFEYRFYIKSVKLDETITLDMKQFEPVAVVCRWFFTLLFIFGLVLITKHVIK